MVARTVRRGTALAAVLGIWAGLAVPSASAGETTTLDVLRVVDGQYVVETVTVPARKAAATEDRLEDSAGVVDAAVQVVYQVQGTPDPWWDEQDPGGASHVRTAWERTTGAGQVVAVLDTAATLDHPDLEGAVVPGTDTAGGTSDPFHGTAVAGVIAARANNGIGSAGLAPDAKVMPVRVCNDSGCTSAAIARGILWAADHGADVINLSLGGPGYSDVIGAAVRYALDKNISVVASAGNSGSSGNPVVYPAANSGVIGVSATEPTGAPASWAQHGWQVDLATVGRDVLVPVPGGTYANASGTSFSGPAVAAAVALLRSSHPGISVEAIQAALQAGVESSSWDRRWGAGRLDVPAALAAADRSGLAVTVTPKSGGLTVSWDAVDGAGGYAVRIDGVQKANVRGTSADLGGLTNGTQVAVDVQPDNGERSRPVLATVGTPPPATPTLYSAAIRGTSTDAIVDLSASVSGAVAPRYAVVRDGVSIGTVTLDMTSSAKTFSILIGPMPVHETRWQLRGLDDLGRSSADSAVAVAGTGKPTPPPAVTGLAVQVDGGDALLTWDDLGTAHTYRVQVDGSTVAAPRTAGAVVPAPAPAAGRTYAVAAVDSWGQAGATVSITVVAPGTPGIGTVTAGNGSVLVSWTPPGDAGGPVSGFKVHTYLDGTLLSITPAAAGATSATVTGLTNGTAYTFAVAATDAAGTGLPSATSAPATPQGSGPGAPGIGAPTAGDASATVRWTAPTTDGGSPVTGYTVRAYAGGSLVRSTTAAAGATSVVVPGLTNGMAHTFTVTAANADGTGPASASSAAVTPRGMAAAEPGRELAIAHRLGTDSLNLWRMPVSQPEAGYGRPELVKKLDFGGFSYDRSRTVAGQVGNVTGADDGSPDHVLWHAQPNGGVLVWGVGGGPDGTPRLWQDLRTGGWSWAGSLPMLGDVTGDGLDDLVVRHAYGSSTTNIWVFPSDGQALGGPLLWGTTYGLAHRSLLADVDSDGKQDLLVARSASGTAGLAYEALGANASGTAFDGFRTTVFTGSAAAGWSETASRTLAGDFTGDGRPDLVTVHAQGSNPGLLVWVHRNCSTGSAVACFADPVIWQDLRTGGWSYAGSRQYVSDTDSDGTDDLVSAHSQGANPGILVWRHRSSSTALRTPEIVADLRSGGWSYAASRATVG